MIYQINNPFGRPLYVVPAGTTVTEAAQDHVFFGDEAIATQKLSEMREAVLVQESYRFVASKVVVDGNDTTWTSADLDQEDGEGDYRVFNQFTGEYEAFPSASSARVRFAELKQEFLASVGLSEFNVVDALPARFAEPVVSGTQSL